LDFRGCVDPNVGGSIINPNCGCCCDRSSDDRRRRATAIEDGRAGDGGEVIVDDKGNRCSPNTDGSIPFWLLRLVLLLLATKDDDVGRLTGADAEPDRGVRGLSADGSKLGLDDDVSVVFSETKTIPTGGRRGDEWTKKPSLVSPA
jgi:hypothetical protein